MRKYAIIPVIIIGAIASFLIGYYMFKISNVENEENQKIILAESINNIENSANIVSIQANSTEDKITPNTKIIKKVYYIDCGHIKEEIEQPTEKVINMNEKEFKKEYVGWEIQRFTSNEVVIYKEVYDYCNEHYVIEEENGIVVVYKIDKDDNEIGKVKTTEIEMKYLTEADIQNIHNSIKVYSKKELNKILEDFE